MKKRAKVLSVILCMGLFASMAIGSGSTDSSSDTKTIVSDSGTQAAEGTAAETAEIQDSAEDKTEDAGKDSDITIEEQVLIDQDDIKVTALSYEKDEIWGDSIKINVENNTSQNIMVGADALIVNDFMITDLFGVEVAAGKKANDEIYLSSSELEAAGIENVGKVEIYFNIYDDDSWDTILKTGPVEIDTSAYDTMDTSVDDSGTELYNENGIRIVGKTVDEDSFWGTAILLYIENTSDKNVGIYVEDMSINGYMIDPLFSADVYAGKKDFTEITLFESDLEENNIESIEEVELAFYIYDLESFEDIDTSDPITFSAQ